MGTSPISGSYSSLVQLAAKSDASSEITLGKDGLTKRRSWFTPTKSRNEEVLNKYRNLLEERVGVEGANFAIGSLPLEVRSGNRRLTMGDVLQIKNREKEFLNQGQERKNINSNKVLLGEYFGVIGEQSPNATLIKYGKPPVKGKEAMEQKLKQALENNGIKDFVPGEKLVEDLLSNAFEAIQKGKLHLHSLDQDAVENIFIKVAYDYVRGAIEKANEHLRKLDPQKGTQSVPDKQAQVGLQILTRQFATKENLELLANQSVESSEWQECFGRLQKLLLASVEEGGITDGTALKEFSDLASRDPDGNKRSAFLGKDPVDPVNYEFFFKDLSDLHGTFEKEGDFLRGEPRLPSLSIGEHPLKSQVTAAHGRLKEQYLEKRKIQQEQRRQALGSGAKLLVRDFEKVASQPKLLAEVVNHKDVLIDCLKESKEMGAHWIVDILDVARCGEFLSRPIPEADFGESHIQWLNDLQKLRRPLADIAKNEKLPDSIRNAARTKDEELGQLFLKMKGREAGEFMTLQKLEHLSPVGESSERELKTFVSMAFSTQGLERSKTPELYGDLQKYGGDAENVLKESVNRVNTDIELLGTAPETFKSYLRKSSASKEKPSTSELLSFLPEAVRRREKLREIVRTYSSSTMLLTMRMAYGKEKGDAITKNLIKSVSTQLHQIDMVLKSVELSPEPEGLLRSPTFESHSFFGSQEKTPGKTVNHGKLRKPGESSPKDLVVLHDHENSQFLATGVSRNDVQKGLNRTQALQILGVCCPRNTEGLGLLPDNVVLALADLAASNNLEHSQIQKIVSSLVHSAQQNEPLPHKAVELLPQIFRSSNPEVARLCVQELLTAKRTGPGIEYLTGIFSELVKTPYKT